MRKYAVSVVMLVVAASLAGCSVNTKMVTRERVDQDLSDSSGNRGYLTGTAPSAGERKTTREYLEVQVEVPSVEKESRVRSTTNETAVTNYETSSSYEPVVEEIEVAAEEEFTDYKVQKNDTLQKISMKFYGTTKKWKNLFNANKDILKSPDRLRPGMTIGYPRPVRSS
jgi:nucleoid-associated protein YgaU